MKRSVAIPVSSLNAAIKSLASFFVLVSFLFTLMVPVTPAREANAPGEEVVLADEGVEESEADAFDNQDLGILPEIRDARLFDAALPPWSPSDAHPREATSVQTINNTGPPSPGPARAVV